MRVGPYNINPETAIDYASVISHEYGHHLGLPDFYSTAGSTYNDLNLMASDYSQHMTVFSKQELGWVVPQFLQPGQSVNVDNWSEIKNDTGKIQWQTPSGQPYTLSRRTATRTSTTARCTGSSCRGGWSSTRRRSRSRRRRRTSGGPGRGNDFGCVPKGGHNFDIALPELASVPAGHAGHGHLQVQLGHGVGLRLRLRDDDDGRHELHVTAVRERLHDAGRGQPEQQRLPEDVRQRPDRYERRRRGRARRSSRPTAPTRRTHRGSPFIDDEYDLSALAGEQNAALRFSYSTDPGVDRPGWFIDDVVVKAGDQVIYSSDFSNEDDLHEFPGGCGKEGAKLADRCTEGWTRMKADTPADLDHGYYVELRDRSGFDYASHGQADRGSLAFDPGVLIEYTDEARGYGNFSAANPPRQHYLDSQPQPGFDCGDNLYETDPQPDVLTPPRCEDASFTAERRRQPLQGRRLGRQLRRTRNRWTACGTSTTAA